MRLVERLRGFLDRFAKAFSPIPRSRGRVQQRRPAAGRSAPGQPAMFVRLADRYLRLGMVDTALHVCAKGLEESPDDFEGLVALSKIYLAKGMVEEARTTAERLINERPESAEAADLYGRLEELGASPVVVGKAVSRERAEDKARKTRTGEIATDTLAELYLRKGDVGRAIEMYEEIFRRKPHNEHVRRKIEDLRALRDERAASAIAGDGEDEDGSWVAGAGAADEEPAEYEGASGAEPEGIGADLGGRIARPGVRPTPFEQAPPVAAGRKLAQVRALESWLRRIRTFRERYPHG